MYEYLLQDESLLEAQTLQPHLSRLGNTYDVACEQLEAARKSGASDEAAKAEVERLRRSLPADFGRWEAAARGAALSSAVLRRLPKMAQMQAEIEAAHGFDKVRFLRRCARARPRMLRLIEGDVRARSQGAMFSARFNTLLSAFAQHNLRGAIEYQAEAHDVYWYGRFVLQATAAAQKKKKKWLISRHMRVDAWMHRKLTSSALTDQQTKWRSVLAAARTVLETATTELGRLGALSAADRAAVLAADKWTTYWKGETRGPHPASLAPASRYSRAHDRNACPGVGEVARVVSRVRSSIDREKAYVAAAEAPALVAAAHETAAAAVKVGMLASSVDASVRGLGKQGPRCGRVAEADASTWA